MTVIAGSPTAAAGAAGSSCPRCRWGCGRTSATSEPLDAAARDSPPRLRPGRHALRPGQQLRPAVRQRGDQLRPDHARGPAPIPRRADHLHQGRLRHVAGPLRRPGLAQVPAGQPGPVAAPDGPGVRRHLLQPTGSTRTRRSRRRWARWTPRSRRARPCTRASRRTRPNGPPTRPGSCRQLGTPLLIHQPSYSMLNRWIEAGLLDVLEPRGRRLHRLLAAGPGRAHRQVSAAGCPVARGPASTSRRWRPTS